MGDITLKDAFDLYLKYRDQILMMWNFFSVVTLGVVAWSLGSDKPPAVLGSAQWIAAGYFVFALGNAIAVCMSQRELRRCASGLAQMAQGQPNASAFIPRPLPIKAFVAFYLVIVFLVDFALLKAGKVI